VIGEHNTDVGHPVEYLEAFRQKPWQEPIIVVEQSQKFSSRPVE